MQLVFDIETNGLLPEVSTLHVCCTYDLDTQEEWYSTDPQAIMAHLSKADHLIGHNIIDYDLPVLDKLINWKPNERTRITDTLVLSRLGNPDRLRHSQMARDGVKAGAHSLAGWGYRVGVGKPEHEDWSTYTEAMLHRCREDVRINAAIYPILTDETAEFGESIGTEHHVQRIISKQERDGVYFDSERAEEYIRELGRRVESIDERITKVLPSHPRQVGATVRKPFKKDRSLIKRVVDMDIHHVAGPFTRIEWHMTDLNSDKEVKEWLLSIGWKPTEWNYSKKTNERTSPKITEDSFDTLPDREIGTLIKTRVAFKHRLGVLKGWVENVRDDHCLAAGANTLGTNTGRMTHRLVANVPQASVFDDGDSREGQLWYYGEQDDEGNEQPKIFGTEMRALFTHRPGRVFLGHDASGIQLRMLAHYMNDPEYTRQILHGDIHSYNQRLAGLPTRNAAKTFIYAFLFGAGDAKLGSIIGGSKNAGSKLRAKFLHELPALGKLINAVKRAAKRGYLIGLDGRKIHMRKDNNGKPAAHKALNTLLQGAEAEVMKKSIVLLDDAAIADRLDYIKVIDMHDEGQADLLPSHAELYGKLAVKSIVDAGLHFDLNIPLDAEYKVGENWSTTH